MVVMKIMMNMVVLTIPVYMPLCIRIGLVTAEGMQLHTSTNADTFLNHKILLCVYKNEITLIILVT